MPLSANFRREMLMAIKNAKKKKEGDETQTEIMEEDSTNDVLYSSKILAKPAISKRNLQADEAPSSGRTASVNTINTQEEEINKNK